MELGLHKLKKQPLAFILKIDRYNILFPATVSNIVILFTLDTIMLPIRLIEKCDNTLASLYGSSVEMFTKTCSNTKNAPQTISSLSDPKNFVLLEQNRKN